MKLRIGNRLLSAREDRKFNQAEMAELLNISTSTYARLERNETSLEMDQLVNFSKTLQIPVQDFLPESFSISSNNHQNQNGHIGLVIGNIYNYADKDEIAKELGNKNQEIEHLQEKIMLLEREIEHLKEINALLRNDKI